MILWMCHCYAPRVRDMVEVSKVRATVEGRNTVTLKPKRCMGQGRTQGVGTLGGTGTGRRIHEGLLKDEI